MGFEWSWSIYTSSNTAENGNLVPEISNEPLCPPHPKKFLFLKEEGVTCQRCGRHYPFPELKNNDPTQEPEPNV